MMTILNSPLKIIMGGMCLFVIWHCFQVLRQRGKWSGLYLGIFGMGMWNMFFFFDIGTPGATDGVESLRGRIVALSSRNDLILFMVMALGFIVKSQFDQYQKRIEELEKKLAVLNLP